MSKADYRAGFVQYKNAFEVFDEATKGGKLKINNFGKGIALRELNKRITNLNGIKNEWLPSADNLVNSYYKSGVKGRVHHILDCINPITLYVFAKASYINERIPYEIRDLKELIKKIERMN